MALINLGFAFKDIIIITISGVAIFSIIYRFSRNFTQYTYEEYKAKMDEKKALRKEAQKEKLKQKLNELEKGD